MNERSRQELFDLGKVYVFYPERSRPSCAEFLGQFTFHEKFRRKTNHKAVVRRVTEIDQKSTEMSGVSHICLQTHSWEGTSQLCDEVIRLSTAKVCV